MTSYKPHPLVGAVLDYADLNPTIGSEINKRRPVLVVSNDANNHAANVVTVLPITSNTQRIYSFEVLLDPQESSLPKVSKAQAQQIRTISKERIVSATVKKLSDELMQQVNAAIKIHLLLE
jgi:mRNA interferase MazF